MLLLSDASNKGWGTYLEALLALGVWDQNNKRLHISILELKANFLALEEFQDRVMGHSLVLMSNSNTAVAYINKEGGLVPFQLHQ